MTPTPPRLLVAGIGNIFHGDDAFGVEVARRLAARPQPEGVRIVDFGIRGLDLAYALLDGHDPVVLLDATSRGGPPGTLYVLELDLTTLDEPGPGLPQTHGLDPLQVFRLVKAMGGALPTTFLVGCEPSTTHPDEEGEMEMSPQALWAVEEAVTVVESLVDDLIGGARRRTRSVSRA